jgi:hypothetical protein
MIRRLAMTCALGLLAIAGTAAGAEPYHAPRTAYGAPDLEGNWTNLSLTQFERPKRFKGLIATDAEAAAQVTRFLNRVKGIKPPPAAPSPNDKAPAGAAPPAGDTNDVGQINSEFPDTNVDLLKIHGQHRSSILVEPADGQIPYTAAGQALVKALDDRDEHDFDNPEARMPDERCIDGTASSTGPPMIGEPQNANYEIVQTPGEIAILSEMIHDVRIVHMGARHPAIPTHPHMGDSIGWWEGETLVIETVDQNAVSAPRSVGPHTLWVSPQAKVVERLTRISPSEILYGFTIEDPTIYSHVMRGEMVLRATKVQQYEYACHEGNYALANILAGARETERVAAAKGAATNR